MLSGESCDRRTLKLELLRAEELALLRDNLAALSYGLLMSSMCYSTRYRALASARPVVVVERRGNADDGRLRLAPNILIWGELEPAPGVMPLESTFC